MSSKNVIEFRDVSKKYSKHLRFNNSIREELTGFFSSGKRKVELHEGEFWVLRDINLNIRGGECIGLHGPNGSGKSTLLKLISHITVPTLGSLNIKTKVAPLIELGAGMHPDLTGIENAYMNGTILGLTVSEVKKKLPEIIDFSGLNDFIEVPVKKYSSGMYLRLAFSIAIHSPVETFLFDEVLAVGDEEFRNKCNRKIDEIKASGKTIIIVSHDIEQMKRLCDRMVELQGGTIISEKMISPSDAVC